jgi:hypothetical protein
LSAKWQPVRLRLRGRLLLGETLKVGPALSDTLPGLLAGLPLTVRGCVLHRRFDG